MKTFLLERDQYLPVPLDRVFAFFSDAQNLERLTPPLLRFEILTPTPIAMGVGTLIDYRIRLRGLPLRWRTEITAWEPPHRFVDTQLKGPYRLWVHEHRFEARGEGTQCFDRVEYAVPGGPGIERVVERLFVRRDLESIFEFRRRQMEDWAREARPATH